MNVLSGSIHLAVQGSGGLVSSCPSSLMSPSINLQHASQSKHCHSVIVGKPQHTAPYINTPFSQPCQNKGCEGGKKKGFFEGEPSPCFGAILELTLYLGLKQHMIHEDPFEEVPSFIFKHGSASKAKNRAAVLSGSSKTLPLNEKNFDSCKYVETVPAPFFYIAWRLCYNRQTS